MSYPKLIHEYLDEGLASPQEEALFSKLAQDPDLRKEFNQQVKIHTITQKDMNSITPPVDATSAVFSGLGFNIPPELIKRDGAITPMPGAAGRFFRRFLPIGISLLLVAFIGILLFTNVIINDSAPVDSENNIKTKAGLSTVKGKNEAYPVVSSAEMKSAYAKENSSSESMQITNATPEASTSGYLSKLKGAEKSSRYSSDLTRSGAYSKTSNSREFSASSTESYEITNEKTYAEIFKSKKIDEKNNVGFINSQYKRKGIELSRNTSTPFESISLNDFMSLAGFVDATKHSLKISGMPIYSVNPNANFDLAKTDIWNASYLYKVNNHYAVGIEGGISNFHQKFNNTVHDIDILQLQNPSLITIGLINKIIAPGLFTDRLKPYAQLFTGIASSKRNLGVVGPLIKPQAGVDYKITPNVGLSLGYEASLLWYKVYSRSYTSFNYGPVIGLSISY